MAESDTTRLVVHRWGADTDTFSRAELDTSMANIEAKAAIFLEGTRAARPAPGITGRFYTVKGDTALLNGMQFYDNGTAWSVVGYNMEDAVARSSAAGTVPLVAKGSASQTANLQEWRDSNNAVKASIDPNGKLTSAGAAISGTTSVATLNVSGPLSGADGSFTTLSASGAFTPSSIVSTAKRADGNPKFRMLADGTATIDGLIGPGHLALTLAATAPAGWMLCQGQSISRTTYPDLFAVIGTQYGSIDSATFKLPDFRNFTPMGASSTKPLGSTAGAETRTLTTNELPAHVHSIAHDHASSATTSDSHNHTEPVQYYATTSTNGSDIRVTDVGNVTGGGGSTRTASTSSDSHSHTVNLPSYAGNSASAGSGAAFSVLSPYLAVNVMVKL